jgi:catechol 2,3-dioxygenase
MYLQHVNVYVRNVERSKTWYEDLLGLHVYEYRPGWAAFLSADEEQSHEVALMQVGEDAPLPSKGQVGLNHMAWRLESLDDLKAFYARLKAEGRPIERIVDHGISLGIYLRDPDGNGVEVFYEMPRAEWPVDRNVFTREKTGTTRSPAPRRRVPPMRPSARCANSPTGATPHAETIAGRRSHIAVMPPSTNSRAPVT